MQKQLSLQQVIAGFALLCTLLCASLPTLAGGYVELPRNLGDLTMGMSEDKFISLTDTTPKPCAI